MRWIPEKEYRDMNEEFEKANPEILCRADGKLLERQRKKSMRPVEKREVGGIVGTIGRIVSNFVKKAIKTDKK
jgi:hypothetical protein